MKRTEVLFYSRRGPRSTDEVGCSEMRRTSDRLAKKLGNYPNVEKLYKPQILGVTGIVASHPLGRDLVYNHEQLHD